MRNTCDGPAIRAVSSGQATWRDLERFSLDYLGARPVGGLSALRFRFEGSEVVEAPEAATVLEIDGGLFACGDYASTPIMTPGGRSVAQLGLNLDRVCACLRERGLPDTPAGIAYLRWAPGVPAPDSIAAPCGVSICGRMTLAIDATAYRECGLELHLYVVTPDREMREVERPLRGSLIRSLLEATVRRDAEISAGLLDAIRGADERVFPQLRRPTEKSLRHAVFPIAAMILG